MTAEKQRGGLVISRLFNAPRSRVWRAWTDPEQFKRWFGPEVYTTPVCRIDLRVGGSYLYCMRSPEGQDFWATGKYLEILPEERLVYTDSFADEHGNVVSPAHYGMPGDMPTEMVVTLTLEDEDGKTRMLLQHHGMPPSEMGEMAGLGWNQSFDKLAETLEGDATATDPRLDHNSTLFTLPSDREAVIQRVFDAPRDLVFRVMTDPRLVPQWWGPERYTTVVDEMDVRPGGRWRYVQRDRDGSEYGFHGIYREVVPPERLSYTWVFEGMEGAETIESMTLTERDGKTLFTATVAFPSLEARNGMYDSGMVSGGVVTYNRLDALLRELQKQPQRA